MHRRIFVLLVGLLACLRLLRAGEIGFVEDFSLAEDRAIPLKQLIPGTEDYYFYHSLHYQHTGQFDKVREILGQWTKRYGETSRVKEIRNRLALLEYDKNPQATLSHIKRELDLRFDHQKQRLDRQQDTHHPTSLDQILIAWDTLRNRAFARHSNNLGGVEDSALETLVKQDLDPDRRRDLLRRLSRPDYPGMAAIVVADLRHPYSGGFGSHPIHRQLLLSQLNECLQLMPELINDTNFINAYLSKLRPNADVSWEYDIPEKKAFLDRMQEFIRRLPPAHNSLKAHILYSRLDLDRQQDVHNKDLFLEYLKLPRNVFYVNRDYLKKADNGRYVAELSANYKEFTTLNPIGMDEPLVRDYLQHFLVDAKNCDEYAEYVESTYLKEIFAETKIVNGLGDMEQWYSLLPPDKYNALKERVELQFLPSNKMVYGARDRVVLAAAVKNVPSLIIKTYRVNTFNYYKAEKRELNTGIDLDGLVANEEQRVEYKQVPLSRHVEKFEFPGIDKPGVYVVELIGNGISSRALIRKGRLTSAERTGSAGHVFAIFDENNKKLPAATLWLAGKEYKADEKGEIAVPYSNQPGSQKIILSHDGFSVLDDFNHQSENYSLKAGIHVDTESLLTERICKVIVRPQLSVNGIPVDVALLEEAALTVRCTDNEGISTSKEIKDFKLQNDRDSVYEFKVPDKLAQVSFSLRGKVENLSQGKKVDLSDSKTVDVNVIDKTDKIETLHLRHISGQYLIEVLGKSGESRADRPVHLEVKHRDFTDPMNVTLQSDAKGYVVLGALKDIAWVKARGPEDTSFFWSLPRDLHSYAAAIHGLAGKPIVIPFMGKVPDKKLDAVSLIEVRDGTFVADYRDSVLFKDGFLVIDDLPAGDYSLFIKESPTTIALRITKGSREGSTLLSRDRMLQVRDMAPLQIAAIEPDDQKKVVNIRLKNVSKSARVHVAATRFVPADDLFDQVGSPSWPELTWDKLRQPESIYLSGRNIGDEYQYILERKYARKFPGNMLKRPSLLLNPWSLRKTEMGEELARSGEPVIMKGLYGNRTRGGRESALRTSAGTGGGASNFTPNLDFLPSASLVLPNLVPDANGIVTLKLSDIGPRQQLHVLAVDSVGAAYREISLAGEPETFLDLRLAQSLDVQKHFTEQKKITAIPAGADFVIPDRTTSQVEIYDSLGKVYSLLATLNPDATLTEFGFVLGWPDLKPEKKRELYSKYACHELSFFLRNKDPEFFKTVILPHLANKKDKTFMDQWLLGANLSEYLKPWAFQRLNIVERALLARRITDETAAGARHVKDLYDLIPPDIDRFNHLFKTALKGSAMETGPGILGDPFARRAAEEAPGFMVAGASGAPAGKAKLEAARNGYAALPATVALPAKPAAPAPPAEKKRAEAAAMKEQDALVNAVVEGEALALDEDRAADEKADRGRRAAVRQLYRKLDKTEEWVENNYYHLPIEQQLADLVTVNAFWKDYAAHAEGTPFLSTSVAEASRGFSEMLMALAVLDLPFNAGKHETKVEGIRLSLKAGSPAIVFHKETREAPKAEKAQPILVSQNFFAPDDRYRHEGNERFDKFVTEEFLNSRVYGCQIVLTNPTSSRRKVDVLLQIPKGALPVAGGFFTRSVPMQLEPYSTSTLDYYFYFPFAGKFSHYPVHVAQNEQVIGFTEPFEFNVVERLTKLDTASWQYISQNGTDDEVIRYLQDNNINRLDLNLIAFRMRNAAFFKQAIPLLQARHVYQDTLWSYGLLHGDVPAIREYLQHSPFASLCGLAIDSPLLTLDPIARYVHQHKEYWPLVNPRVYRLGKKRDILNHQFYDQYNQWLACLQYRPALGDVERMVTAVYLLLQDRNEEAAKFFAAVNPKAAAPAMQYDYLKAYLAFCQEKSDEARAIAKKYQDYPVDRWRFLFQDILAQADEIQGRDAKVVDKDDRAQIQTRLAETEPGFDFKVEDRKIAINYQNIDNCRINYYLMDIELLFSRNPFVQEVSGRFSVIDPNTTQQVDLPKKKNTLTLDVPKEYRDSNVMIEIVSGGVSKTQAYYPHSLNIQILENYGQIKVADLKSQKPLAKVYVKVFAKMKNGQVQFYKDGYTDLRGRFDYTSLNTNEIENVQKFSILIMSDANGSVVREASPPKM